MTNYCYMIITKKNNKYYNYIGYTNNPNRRIRQHNQLIKGGAKATKKYTDWEFLFIIQGYKTKNEALSCEWKLKHPNNKYKSSIKSRLENLTNLFTINNKFTSKCKPIHKNDTYMIYYNKKYNEFKKNILFNNILFLNINFDNKLKNIIF